MNTTEQDDPVMDAYRTGNVNEFEDAWADIYWTFAHDDMAFDYRSQYYKERFLKVKAGLVDFEKLTLVRD